MESARKNEIFWATDRLPLMRGGKDSHFLSASGWLEYGGRRLGIVQQQLVFVDIQVFLMHWRATQPLGLLTCSRHFEDDICIYIYIHIYIYVLYMYIIFQLWAYKSIVKGSSIPQTKPQTKACTKRLHGICRWSLGWQKLTRTLV